MLTGHPVVDAIANLPIRGNIVHHQWYKHLRYTNKRGEFTDPWACLILADIVYWYRPIDVRNELTGEVIGCRKKFAEDKLQRSPDAFAQLLGCSVRVARDSLALLESLGIIDIELRAVKTGFGTVPTCMFIGLNPERLSEITYLPPPKPETLEKSLLPISVRRNDEMGNKERRNGVEGTTISVTSNDEMGKLSIYRDFTESTQRVHIEEEAATTAQPPEIESISSPEVSAHPSVGLEKQDSESLPKADISLEDKFSAAAPDAEILLHIQKIAYDWRERPWMASSHTFKPEMIRAVWEANSDWYSLPECKTPNLKKIIDRLRKLDSQLKALNDTAIAAYSELSNYWAMAQAIANPEIRQSFEEAAIRDKQQQIYNEYAQALGINPEEDLL